MNVIYFSARTLLTERMISLPVHSLSPCLAVFYILSVPRIQWVDPILRL